MRKSLDMILLLLVSVNLSFAQWVQQASPTTSDLMDVRFVGRQTGWVVGRSVVLRTTNYGFNWTKQDFPGFTLWRLAFVNSNTGWCVGTTSTRRGLIMNTQNGGGSWNVQDSSISNLFLNAVFFLDANNGWAAGGSLTDTSGSVLRTTNGGTTWQRVDGGNLQYINDLFFHDSMNGWAVGEWGYIYKTNDGGVNWSLVYQVRFPTSTSYLVEPLRRIQFSDRNNGWTVGGIAGVEVKVRTTDGGITWQVLFGDGITWQGSSLHGLSILDSQNGWTVGGANSGLRIEKTLDGGKSWTLQPHGISNIFYFESVYMFSMDDGWIVGDFGTILKLGVITRVGQQTETIPAEFSLSQNYPNPFNPSTTIEYQIPREGYAKLSVFNSLGQVVAVLADGLLKAGTHRATFTASGLGSGVYFCRLETPGSVATRKLILLK